MSLLDRLKKLTRYARPYEGGAWTFSWQNLNDRPEGADGVRPHGLPTHARAWLRIGEVTMRAEWVLGGHRTLGLAASADPFGDDALKANVQLLPCALFLGVSSPRTVALAGRLCPDGEARQVSAYVDFASECVDGPHVHWSLFAPKHSWSRATPKWRDGGFFLWEALFGSFTIVDRELSNKPVVIPLPERLYVGRAELVERTYTRPRWPGVWTRFTTGTVYVEGGVPVPGRGESWSDQDQDVTHSLSTAARSVPESIGKFVANILRTRERRGGPDWRPAPPRNRKKSTTGLAS